MGKNPNFLSKSSYVCGCQCLRRLYWQYNPPADFEYHSEASQILLQQGRLVGELARTRFPGGIHVDAGPDRHSEAVTLTHRLMADPSVSVIYEAGFTADSIRIRTDILVRLLRKQWQLIEVKQTTEVKDHHLWEVAIQKYVMQHSGIRVGSACLMHIDNSYVYDGIRLDPYALFAIEDIDDQIGEAFIEIPNQLAQQWHVLGAQCPPDILPASQCTDPFTCEFYDICNPPLPVDHIGHLPRISPLKMQQLGEMGIQSIREIPSDFKLSPPQKRAWDSIRHMRLVIDSGIHKILRSLRYPLFFMDFETINPAIPLYRGTRPFQQIPFQWSVHVQSSPGAKLDHYEFLAEDESDPREPFIVHLLKVLETGDGNIIVYNQSFEEQRLIELATWLPQYAARIEIVRARLWDLLPVIRNHVYHPEFCGSFSIKSVLPALVPSMSYEALEVSNGNQAGEIFQASLHPELPQADREQMRRSLLEYCGQDTKAMHEILRLF